VVLKTSQGLYILTDNQMHFRVHLLHLPTIVSSCTAQPVGKKFPKSLIFGNKKYGNHRFWT